jgi:hypothetical protein
MAGVRRALRHSLRPSFYDDHEDVLAPSIGRACMHLCAVCAVLSLPATLSLLVRLGPAIAEKKPLSVLAGGSLGALILGSEMSSTRRSLGRSTMR